MSSWLSKLVLPLLLLLASSIVSGFLKGPLDNWANQNRLNAEIQLAPWVDKPNFDQDADAEGDTDPKDDIDNLIKYLTEDITSLNSATILIENNSRNKITNINFSVESFGVQDILILEPSGKRRLIQGKTEDFQNRKRIYVSDMDPGDIAKVFIWGNFVTYEFPEGFRSHSSEGAFRTSFDWPQTQEVTYEGGFIGLIDDYAWIVGTVSLILLLIILSIGLASHWEYVKVLLTYSRAYEIERERFWKNPKKFSPSWNIVNQNHYKPHGLFGEPDKIAKANSPDPDDESLDEPSTPHFDETEESKQDDRNRSE